MRINEMISQIKEKCFDLQKNSPNYKYFKGSIMGVSRQNRELKQRRFWATPSNWSEALTLLTCLKATKLELLSFLICLKIWANPLSNNVKRPWLVDVCCLEMPLLKRPCKEGRSWWNLTGSSCSIWWPPSSVEFFWGGGGGGGVHLAGLSLRFQVAG